jgi:hypothetical protein
MFNSVYGLQETYELQVNEQKFDIQYDFDGKVLAMAIDEELTSLLVGIETNQDSIFKITLPNEVINAENNEFVVLVDSVEADYLLYPSTDYSTLDIFIPNYSQEIEIIGTYVVPEFPIGVLLIFLVVISFVTIMTKQNPLRFK